MIRFLLIVLLALPAGATNPIGTKLPQQNHPIVSTGASSTAVTVTTTAGALPATAKSGRMSLIVYNNCASTVYIGGASVTSSNGLPLVEGASISFDLSDSAAIYGRMASGTCDVRVLEN